MLYPLKFKPAAKSKIWGGDKLRKYLNHNDTSLPNIGETWDISGLDQTPSVISNGFLKGNSLSEILETYMVDLVGTPLYEKYNNYFPLLIKLIDAQDDLSIQVHPNDEMALELYESLGKSEMWYVLEADKEAAVILGFTNEISPEEYRLLVEQNELNTALKKIPVSKGDIINIPSGTVHALCKGTVVLEVQQASDVTYRIYDYDRVGDDGQKRELSTDLAERAIDFAQYDCHKTNYNLKLNQAITVIDNEHFSCSVLEFNQAKEYNLIHLDTFVILTCLEGEFLLQYGDENFVVKDGESVFIPAEMESFYVIPQTTSRLLETYAH